MYTCVCVHTMLNMLRSDYNLVCLFLLPTLFERGYLVVHHWVLQAGWPESFQGFLFASHLTIGVLEL